jgi:hypothetical protein
MGLFCNCKNYDQEMGFLVECYDSLKKEMENLEGKLKQYEPHVAEMKRDINNLMKPETRSKDNSRPIHKQPLNNQEKK